MSNKPGTTIFSNALPSSAMPTFNGPKQLLEKVGASIIPTAVKQTFGQIGDSFEISLIRFAGGVQRVKLSAITSGTSGQYDHGFKNVDEMVFWFQGDRKPFGPTSAKHHIQSANFQFELVREIETGRKAAQTNAAKLLALLEEHGAEFLDSIDDPNLASDAAVALLGVRAKLSNPVKTFGPGAIEADLSPDAIKVSDRFRRHAEGKILLEPAFDISPKGVFHAR
ncbi:MAG: hypothetical protein U0R17_02835 [Acidimicrobiia bacterium]